LQDDPASVSWRERLLEARDGVVRAYRDFLRTPTIMVTGFLLLAVGLYLLDRHAGPWVDPMRAVLQKRLFVDAGTTSDFLSAIAGGIISVTSITISLLLLAVQQSAASLTPAVLDQFLRRTRNQAYFGYFIGLALYCLVVLSTVHHSSNAVFSATVAFALTVVALYLLIVLLYSTIHQMQPAVVVSAITDQALRARAAQRQLLARTRRAPALQDASLATTRVEACERGYLVRLHLDRLAKALEEHHGVEVVLLQRLGAFCVPGDSIAEIRGGDAASHEAVACDLRAAMAIERQRASDCDPGKGIDQIARIGWGTISSAKSNPGPAIHAIRGLRELLSRWAAETPAEPEGDLLPLVYEDPVPEQLLDALESCAVSCSESRQHQSFAEIMIVFTTTAPRLPVDQREAMADMVWRCIPMLGEMVLSRELCEALADAASRLREFGRGDVADRIWSTPDRLGRRMGVLA